MINEEEKRKRIRLSQHMETTLITTAYNLPPEDTYK